MAALPGSNAAPNRKTAVEAAAVRLVLLATAANILGYMDRVCVSVVAPQLRSEFGFTPTQMGVIFGAFSLSYALFQAPWGAAADRTGARKLVAMAIGAWSGFTALTALAWNYVAMVSVRFLFGISEAVISPAMASAFSRVIPQDRRSTAFGFFLAGGRTGGAIAPFITALITVRYGWRAIFWIFAGIGILAAFAWLAGVPMTTGLPQVDRRTETRGPRLRFSVPLAALMLVSFSYTLSWQFYTTWFPTYLIKGRGFTLSEAGIYAGLPFLFGLMANWIGGLLSDALARRFGVRVGRRVIGLSALLTTALLMMAGAWLTQRAWAAILIALAAGSGDLMLGTSWASAVDIGGKAAGVASGLLNMASNLGGFVSPIVIGWMLQTSSDWRLILSVAAACDVVAAFFWLFVTPPTMNEGTKERVAAN